MIKSLIIKELDEDDRILYPETQFEKLQKKLRRNKTQNRRNTEEDERYPRPRKPIYSY